MNDAHDLAAVLRRLATDPGFAEAVDDDPRAALEPYQLTALDLSALALWLERSVARDPAAAAGVRGLFEQHP